MAGWLGGGQGHGEKMSLSGEDVVVNINGKHALLRKEQVEVFEHLSQKERVHPTNQHIDIHIQRGCFTVSSSAERLWQSKYSEQCGGGIDLPVFMDACADILHSSKPTRHSGVGVELLHDGLSHSEVVGVASSLKTSRHHLKHTYRTSSFLF